MNLDWRSIRPLNGGRDKSFEELCAQLARAETPREAQFERKGTPDAGVECYAILSDSSEWAWQSKYFDTLGSSQWSQINKSVKAAIEKHPRLVRYFVCTPLDRPDARLDGKKSAMDRWNEYVSKWNKLATEKGMSVEFIYWGSSELLELLVRPEHVGRVRFWFDVQGFDKSWFNARLGEALRAAGPRYTPEVHVDLPIASEFEAFGRTESFFEREKARARAIRQKLRNINYSTKNATDETLGAALANVSEKVESVLTSISAIRSQPSGTLPFNAINEQIYVAIKAAQELSPIVIEREREFEAKAKPTNTQTYRASSHNPFRELWRDLSTLSSELQETYESFEHADCIASNTLMLLRGKAGTGKTHLLCDVARQRIAAGRPTVLLMGQRFVSNDAPWSQAFQQLDLADISAEKFVGALEAAAQAAGSRALLMIDALNEGNGREIWPSHLAPFLAQVERSSWIGVVLAVRSSYEEIVVSEEVRKRAFTVTHQGFIEHEYNATKIFFTHYGLEFPSTPLLTPEFRNPLFLKKLCQGLSKKGEHRLPRGFHGITSIFNLYLNAVNKQLATTLDYDKKEQLVQKALAAIAEACIDSGESWLTRTDAKGVVDAILPGRGFNQSLYRGLVTEGVLIEEGSLRRDVDDEIVSISYERFGDHLTAKTLLDKHLDVSNPTAAFVPGGALAFICDEQKYVPPGLREALCIQIPERIGKELPSVAPDCVKQWGLSDAFRQSLIWRDYAAFSDKTREVLNELHCSKHDSDDTLDVLLTVATLPEHPFNVLFLEQRLRKDSMPDRDAWWSVYLHQEWDTHSTVDRLVDWASSVNSETLLDEEAVRLCAITLSWMFTTSNRFLRDRATKALVNLLTGRLDATARLVEHFADVDDPYVAERVYAVAYGVAMRCRNANDVGILAVVVYNHVFAAGSPLPHILVRDYARGVIERALHLGSEIEVNVELIRPPYKSNWPTIPSEDDIKSLVSNFPKDSHESLELERMHYAIKSSVMSGDFAHYVIGTNYLSSWLSLKLDEPIWEPPLSPKEQLKSLVAEFLPEELAVWEEFEVIAKSIAAFKDISTEEQTQHEEDKTKGNPNNSDSDANDQETQKTCSPEFAELEKAWDKTIGALEDTLTEKHLQRLNEIWDIKENSHEIKKPPGFDLRQIQNYILWRVFDLGWTVDRFGDFDRFQVRSHGREAAKAERIGKKYQWLAYHEFIAFLSDHFQYRKAFRGEGGKQAYEGPWQERLRDIDPSCTLKSVPRRTPWDSHTPAWWGAVIYDSWGNPNSPKDWVLNCDNLPTIEDLLIVTNPADGSRWLNGHGHFTWEQQLPADRDYNEVEHRELWYVCKAYLIRANDTESFMEWAEEVNFWEHQMPEPADVYKMFLGEHAWSPAAHYLQKPYDSDDGWINPERSCPVKLRSVALEYPGGVSSFDCSIDEGFTLQLPVSDLVAGLRLQWSGSGADFVDTEGRIVVQDPAVHADGPTALLFREEHLQEFLDRENLTICWAVLGEKRLISPGFNPSHNPWLRMSGAYMFSEGRAIGFIKRRLDDPKDRLKDGSLNSKIISIAKTES